jgi:hypothetical protein
MTLNEAIEVYRAGTPVEQLLPMHASKFDFIMEEVKGTCPKCGGPLIGLRGSIQDHGHCLEVRMHGVCQKDKMLVEMKPFRHYSDGRCMWREDHGQWVQGQPVTAWWDTIVQFVKGLVGR